MEHYTLQLAQQIINEGIIEARRAALARQVRPKEGFRSRLAALARLLTLRLRLARLTARFGRPPQGGATRSCAPGFSTCSSLRDADHSSAASSQV
jgi:hypothetical protein